MCEFAKSVVQSFVLHDFRTRFLRVTRISRIRRSKSIDSGQLFFLSWWLQDIRIHSSLLYFGYWDGLKLQSKRSPFAGELQQFSVLVFRTVYSVSEKGENHFYSCWIYKFSWSCHFQCSIHVVLLFALHRIEFEPNIRSGSDSIDGGIYPNGAETPYWKRESYSHLGDDFRLHGSEMNGY
jgi:hypothetical protein